MKRINLIAEQARDDFNKARTRETIGKIVFALNPQSQQLLSFEDVKEMVKPKSQSYRGMQTVPISKIVGSEGRYGDFNRTFLPKHNWIRGRWENIDKAHLDNIILPPIKVYKIGEAYFVRDGNHRVSVARMQGGQEIDAEVIELTTVIPVGPGMTMEELKKEVIEYEKREIFAETELGGVVAPDDLTFTEPGRYYELLKHINGHKYFLNLDKKEEISFLEAAKSWHETLYLPLCRIIEEENILARFPGRTKSDLYVWIVKHWHYLKEKYGDTFSLKSAALSYAETYGKSPWQIIKERVRRIVRYFKH